MMSRLARWIAAPFIFLLSLFVSVVWSVASTLEFIGTVSERKEKMTKQEIIQKVEECVRGSQSEGLKFCRISYKLASMILVELGGGEEISTGSERAEAFVEETPPEQAP